MLACWMGDTYFTGVIPGYLGDHCNLPQLEHMAFYDQAQGLSKTFNCVVFRTIPHYTTGHH